MAGASTNGASGFTLELKQVAGTYRGDGVQLGAYELHVLDDNQRELGNVQLRAPIQIRFHYGTQDLSGVNASTLRLVWPTTANRQAKRPAQSVPLTLDAKARTLTATVSTLYAGTMVMSATLSDANAASSEHVLVAGNTGDMTFSLPLATPPAAGGLAPDLTMTYSSAGPNGRTSREAPAPWVGDGWDLSLGSITYDATTGLFYLNGVGGENEALLCCVVDAAHGNVNYFVPHHHDSLHITTYPNTQHPNTTGSVFILRTPDNTEYDFGATADSRRSTVTGGGTTYYEWDLNAVLRQASTNAGYLQQYTISYWQDMATSGGVTYVRDAAPRQINYNYVNGNPQDQIWFNVHWPGSTTTSGSATATSYGTNYNCASAPLIATTLRCDDPVTPSGYEAAPLTMTTFTLDSLVMETWAGSQWQNTRRYDFSYAPDSANYSCWDDVTGLEYACSGEHLLTSVQETPYLNNVAAPSRQPITFQYTAPQKNEYNDYTQTGFDGNPFDAQTWWQYLQSFSDAQTGASASVQWQTAWANTHGVPSGYDVLNPWTCGTVTCSRPDDRQWMRQTVASVTDLGTNTTTSYSYRLNQACGAGCTQDTWIAPNAFNACGGQGQGPTYPNSSCLISGPYTNYYDEDYTGFLQVYVTDPTGATAYTQYFAGDGWGSNDWQFPNAYHGFPVVEQSYAGGARGTPLEEVDHTYTESNCPPIASNGNQLYVNNLMMCDTWETQRDTYSGGSSGTSGIPHKTETWNYDATPSPALGLAYNSMTADAVTSNDALADSVTNYGSTQPTFTTNFTYVRHDGNLDSPPNGYYLANLPAQVTLDDSAGNRWSCQQISYDGQAYATGQTAAITDGLATRVDAWTNCGSSANGYAASGVVTTGTGYDANGQPVVTTDADALAGIAGHTGCSAPATPSVVYPTGANSYSACTGYDSAQNVYPTGDWNALFKQSVTTYDVVQGVATSGTDANGVTTSYGDPVYEYSGAPSLATFQDVYSQTTLPGEALGGSSPWTTRTFAYSFCAGATASATSPCLEVDTVRQYDASDTLVTRTFYDRDGRQVETRTTSPVAGQDTVTLTVYNDTNNSTWASLPCTVATLTTGNGGRTVSSTANYIAPTQTSSGSSAYVDPTVGGTSCSSGALTGTTTWSDALGRAIASDDPLGTGVGASGTGCVLPGGSVHHTTCVTYTPVVASATAGLPSGDGEPYLQAVTIDGNLHQQASYTDALGRVAYTQELAGESQQALGSGVSSYAVTTNQYDPTGTLRRVTDAQGQVTTFTTDALGRQTALSDPDRGSERYSYDPNGNILTTVDARGASGTIDAGYDGLNRQLWRNTTNSPTGAYVTYSYDSVASGNDGVGRLTGESFSNSNVGGTLSGSYATTYDSRGRVTATVETLNSVPYATGAAYNDANQLVSQTYPNGDTLTSVYDGATGQESSLSLLQSGASTAVNLLANETYSGQAGAAGLLTSASLGGFTSGSGGYSASYDGLLRLSSAAYSYTPTGGSASTLYDVQPSYDAVGNVAGVTTTLPQGVDTQAFCYDAQNRLTWAGSTGTPACGSSLTPGDTGSLSGAGARYSASYSYDTRNRLTSAPLGSYSYGDDAHVDAATAVGATWTASYDAAGNMTCRAASSATTCAGSSPTGALLSYDNEGRLATWQNAPTTPTSSASYLYDGEGQRVEQVATAGGGATTTSYIGALEEVTTSGSGTTTTAYYGSLAQSVNGALSYTLSDGLGSVSESVNTAGQVTATQLYRPYGTVRYQSGTLPTDYGFTGQRADASTSGLDYYGARYYDPVAGQFTSADTTRAGGLNRYAYVAGNPETNTDPSGHILRAPRDFNTTFALSQPQPAQVYANQWAAPGSVGGFVSYVGQAVLGTDTLGQSFHTLFQDPQASAGDKWKAAAAVALTLASDALTLGGTFVGDPEVGEAARAAEESLLLADDAAHTAAAAAEATLENAAEHTVEHGAVDLAGTATEAGEAGGACGLSFAADTQVATPQGEQPIAALHVGDHVSAYDPATGKPTTQTIERMFLNHDTDRLDVTLAVPQATPQAKASAAETRGNAPQRQAPYQHNAQAAGAQPRAQEVIHTTANHPWLTADRGWVVAGHLHNGEPVRLLDGATATVVALQALPGVGPMWDLSLDATHTFAVGDVQAVVHNCPPTDNGMVSGGTPDLYHGTDIGSAKTMVNKGIDRGAAAQYGGDGQFYATTNLTDARYFAEGNPAGGPPAIVGINLSTGVSGAVDQGILTPMEGFPGAYTVANTRAAWKAFNNIATFSLVDFEP